MAGSCEARSTATVSYNPRATGDCRQADCTGCVVGSNPTNKGSIPLGRARSLVKPLPSGGCSRFVRLRDGFPRREIPPRRSQGNGGPSKTPSWARRKTTRRWKVARNGLQPVSNTGPGLPLRVRVLYFPHSSLGSSGTPRAFGRLTGQGSGLPAKQGASLACGSSPQSSAVTLSV